MSEKIQLSGHKFEKKHSTKVTRYIRPEGYKYNPYNPWPLIHEINDEPDLYERSGEIAATGEVGTNNQTGDLGNHGYTNLARAAIGVAILVGAYVLTKGRFKGNLAESPILRNAGELVQKYNPLKLLKRTETGGKIADELLDTAKKAGFKDIDEVKNYVNRMEKEKFLTLKFLGKQPEGAKKEIIQEIKNSLESGNLICNLDGLTGAAAKEKIATYRQFAHSMGHSVGKFSINKETNTATAIIESGKAIKLPKEAYAQIRKELRSGKK